MSILNIEELRKQISNGTFKGLDHITDEFKNIIREVIETASQEEIKAHLGYEKSSKSSNSNYRNGYNKKNIKCKYGDLDVSIPRDRDSSFEPQLIKKREVLLNGSEDLILSLYTSGMSVRDIQVHLDDLYGYELSAQTISNITHKIIEKANDWQQRPLDKAYAIVFMDATIIKVRVDRVVKNVAAYIMLGINLEGKKEIIGIWIGENETSKYWLTVLNDIRNRGVEDILIFAIDGLKGFNQAIQAAFPKAEIQKCIVHQIRNSLKFVSWKDKKAVSSDLKAIYNAVNEESARIALREFSEIWVHKYPSIARSWENNWNELSTFFKYPKSIRKLIYTTNPIESLNSIIKRKSKSKGSFPNEESAFKFLFLSIQQIQKKWEVKSIKDWGEIYHQLSIFFSEIMVKYNN